MPRFFAPITVEDLDKKITAKGGGSNYNFVWDDLKVDFDFENVSTSTSDFGKELDGLLGFNTLDNGMTFLGVYAGGDWEIAVFFICYWDGKKLRAYVPTKGNRWNTDTKRAYGNADDWDGECEDEDAKNLKKLYGPECVSPEDAPLPNKEEIIADIKARILPKK